MSKYVVTIGMDDVPHISDEEAEDILADFPIHQRKARRSGTPSLGAGAIYPFDEETVFIDPIPIPQHWPQGYGMDVGWHNTAAVWGAWDRDSDIVYITSDHKMGETLPAIHASAIKARGDWMRGAIDPASNNRSQKDGERLMQVYIGEGLKLQEAERQQRESGILECQNRFGQGRLKIFSSCNKTRSEYRLYRRDEKGKVVKEYDHLMDAMRYFVMNMQEVARVNRRRVISYRGNR